MLHSFGRILVLLAIGGCAFVIIIGVTPIVRSSLPTRTVLYPLPHQIPKYPGGTSLRFAMVHDVIHDRYPRHGKVYYQERNRRVLGAIAKNKGADGLPPPDQFGLIDDLGVGLDTLGESDEAARWLRLKLKAQEKLGLHGKELYTSYANLGTFLIHGNSAKAMSGNKEAQESVREGLQHLHKSIEVNPEAHFGREIWQAVVAEFMLRVSEDRMLLLKRDIFGNDLELKYSAFTPHAMASRHKTDVVRRVDAYLKKPDDPNTASELRKFIQTIGEEPDHIAPIRAKTVPFDEPCLGIIGMWRLGGGANPHFALALAETMMRINQRQLAWAAYQRAIREAPRFSPDEAIRAKLIERCKGMQEALISFMTEKEMERLAGRFESELQIGQGYQRAYQKYEEDQIAAGKDLDDPHFYDAFHAVHGNIATPIGEADFLAVQEVTPRASAWMVFAGGSLVFVVALLLLLWQRRRRRTAMGVNIS
jgi:hypothetical protein